MRRSPPTRSRSSTRSATSQRHGWGYTWGFETTDANSTALVIQAYAAAGTPVPDRRAGSAAQAAGSDVRRLVLHLGRPTADGPGSGLHDRRGARPPAAAAAAGAGRGRGRGGGHPRLRIAMHTGTGAFARGRGLAAARGERPRPGCAGYRLRRCGFRRPARGARGRHRASGSPSYCVALDASSVDGMHLIELASEQYGLGLPAGVRRPGRLHAGGRRRRRRRLLRRLPELLGVLPRSRRLRLDVGDGERGRSSGAPTATARRWSWGAGDSGTTHGAPPATSIDDACGTAPEPEPEPPLPRRRVRPRRRDPAAAAAPVGANGGGRHGRRVRTAAARPVGGSNARCERRPGGRRFPAHAQPRNRRPPRLPRRPRRRRPLPTWSARPPRPRRLRADRRSAGCRRSAPSRRSASAAAFMVAPATGGRLACIPRRGSPGRRAPAIVAFTTTNPFYLLLDRRRRRGSSTRRTACRARPRVRSACS